MSRNQVVLWLFVILSVWPVAGADAPPNPAPSPSPIPECSKPQTAQAVFGRTPRAGKTAPVNVGLLRELITCEGHLVRAASACSQALRAQRDDATKDVLAACEPLQRRMQEQAKQIPSTAATLGLQPGTGADESAGLRALLVEQRRRYKAIRKWINALSSDPAAKDAKQELEDAKQELQGVRETLYKVLETEGLREDFGAEVVQGLMLENTAGEPGGGNDNAQPTYLRIRSRRFGHDYDQDRNLEYMLTVRLGKVPTLLLVEPASQPPATPGSATPAANGAATAGASDSSEPATTHEKAFMFDLRLDGILTTGASSEFVFGLSYGQTMLDSKSLIRKVGGQDTLFQTLSHGPGTWAEFWTAGFGYRYFHRAVRDIRAEQPSIDPLLEASVDFRRDARLEVDPATAGAVRFERPEQRLVFRLKFAGIPLVDMKNPAAKPVTIGLGIEHERGLSRHGAPAATRIFLMADLSILKAFAGK